MRATTKKKKVTPVLSYVEAKGVIGEIKSDLYTITVTKTHAVIKTTHYTYVVDNTCPTYVHWEGLIDLYKNPKRTEEEDNLLDTLLILYTNAINWHTLWFQDAKLMNDMWNFHTDWLNNETTKAMEAELQDDDPNALKELMETHEFQETINAEIAKEDSAT